MSLHKSLYNNSAKSAVDFSRNILIAKPREVRAALLSRRELQRIVADMIG